MDLGAVPDGVVQHEAIAEEDLDEECDGGDDEGEEVGTFAGFEIAQRERGPAEDEVKGDHGENDRGSKGPCFPAEAGIVESSKAARSQNEGRDEEAESGAQGRHRFCVIGFGAGAVRAVLGSREVCRG